MDKNHISKLVGIILKTDRQTSRKTHNKNNNNNNEKRSQQEKCTENIYTISTFRKKQIKNEVI